jgi:CubicO group peptidase (beta-lactamase class C family)
VLQWEGFSDFDQMAQRYLTRVGWLAAIAVLGVLVSAARSVGVESGSPNQGGAVSIAARTDIPLPALSIAAIDDAAKSLPRLHSLLVSRHGEVIAERYYNGVRADRPQNIKSASKSVISALIGIALDRGLIADVKTPLATFFPELSRDAAKQRITVEDLLTMRSGLEGTSNRNYGAWVVSRNWVQHALARPMFAPPGEVMEYSTGNTHLLSAILTKVSGKSTWQFANDVLAAPLGFNLPQWPRDPQGIYFGGNDMLMTSRQLLAFGELYLNQGRMKDRQVVPASWVERSCQGRPRVFRPGDRRLDVQRGFDPMGERQYGYGWWVHQIEGHDTCFAWGFGGQYVFVLPDLDMVVVTTSSSETGEERRDHRMTVLDIVSRLVVQELTPSKGLNK